MTSYASQFFPARNLLRFKRNSGSDGAWLIAYKEEQKRRFDAVLCPDKLKSTSKPDKKTKDNKTAPREVKNKQIELSGIYLLQELNVDDPSDIASINIIAKDLVTAVHEDFVLFDNVEHIEAGENQLTIDSFKTFPALRELELQLNSINHIKISPNDFPYLELLDLSCNDLMPEDVLSLGLIPILKCLVLTGNGLKYLPTLKSSPTSKSTDWTHNDESSSVLFEFLEILILDENEFEDDTVFASLSSLPRLKILNLSKNCLRGVPVLQAGNPASLSSKNSAVHHGDDGLLVNFSHPETDGQVRLENSAEELLDEAETAIPQMPPLDEDYNLGLELRIDKLGDDLLEEKETENVAGLSSKDSFDMTRDMMHPHFMHLEKLDISDNLIEEEEALLALAAWPSLLEVNFWDNPLTRNCKGPPPLLQYHLSKLCGIKLNRKKTKTLKKPAVGPVITPAVKYNKVVEMPNIKRSNMLMLEFESYEAALQDGSLYKKQPLPSITPSNDRIDTGRHSNNSSDNNSSNNTSIGKSSNYKLRQIQSAPTHDAAKAGVNATGDASVTDRASQKQRPCSVAQDKFFPNHDGDDVDNAEETESRSDVRNAGIDKAVNENEKQQDGVFLTQFDGAEEDIEHVESAGENRKQEQPIDDKEQSGRKSTENSSKPLLHDNSKYSKYEELLEIEGSQLDDIETPPVKDVRGNVKALHHALNHPLVFNEPDATSESDRQIYTQHKESRSPATKSMKKGDRVKAVIDAMKDQSNIVEEDLDVVLERYDTDPQIRKKFPEVKKLLNEVQSKYNTVRLRSLESAFDAQKMLSKTSTKPARNTLNGRPLVDKKHLQTGLKLTSLQKDFTVSSSRNNSTAAGQDNNAGKSSIGASDDGDVSKKLSQFKSSVDKRI